MRDGSFAVPPVPWPFDTDDVESGCRATSSLYTIALVWLKEDRELRRSAEKAGTIPKTRGSRVSIDPSNPRMFSILIM